MATVKTVETLIPGEIATFRQDPEYYNGAKVHRREKVTGVVAGKTKVTVKTVTRRGKKDQYTIPVGTDMRVHNEVQAED